MMPELSIEKLVQCPMKGIQVDINMECPDCEHEGFEEADSYQCGYEEKTEEEEI